VSVGEQLGDASAITRDVLGVDQQSEALVKGKARQTGIGLLSCMRHAIVITGIGTS
jgi:hypothetical protein